MLAKELQAALRSGNGKRPRDLATDLGVSRARVSQLLRVLRLSPRVLEAIEHLGDRWPTAVVGEHSLRNLVGLPETRQLLELKALLETRLQPAQIEKARGTSQSRPSASVPSTS